jgi:preprotein translocase subunit SecG
MSALNIILMIIQLLIAVGLIYIIAIQQPKTEGMGAAISSASVSSFKGKPGFEQRLSDLTVYLGIAFFATSILVAVDRSKLLPTAIVLAVILGAAYFGIKTYRAHNE